MKKVLVVFCVLGFLFGVVGAASAIIHTDTKTLGVTLAEGPIAGIFYPSSHSYIHDTPDDFGVPPDYVNSATLDISGYWIDGTDDQVRVEEKVTGSSVTGSLSVGSFSIASIFVTWTAESLLKVTISANGSWGDGILRLASSTFRLDYDENDDSIDTAAPVAEPATMLLLGCGLIGLASFGRKKLFTKASF